ncbi:6-phosphogluconate dehydrogenase [Leucosporidium creatinivorum]|uniref:6-phosphogluconate dehydrogenase n=1 Tax=Leucosporidium creatinivorum TaxID=106004 RepID=A0A1Y2EC30_9BASI|nr:6-phosphogluconate dehydrogenase [Leucosporidium creatinivorum]
MAPSLASIAILASGQMGSSFAALLRTHSPSIRLITNLEGRSPRTVSLAREAGIEDVGSNEAVLKHSDLIFSILVPSQAVALGQSIASSAAELPPSSIRTKFYIDLNAIAPSTTQSISKLFAATSIAFVDGGVIGGPATPTTSPLIAISGPQAAELNESLSPFFSGRTKVVGSTDAGQASALKLSYASLSKGLTALATNASVFASEHGVLDVLVEELGASNPGALKVVQNSVPRATAKAFRWVGEMQEISTAFAEVGLAGGAKAFAGIAETYEFVAANDEVGKESIEEALEKGRSHGEVVAALAKDLKRPAKAE